LRDGDVFFLVCPDKHDAGLDVAFLGVEEFVDLGELLPGNELAIC